MESPLWYVSNFISVHRVRPGNDDEDEMDDPDDLMSDEELLVTKDMLEEVLETRIGGKVQHLEDEAIKADGHHLNSSEAIGLGRDIWSKLETSEGSVAKASFTFDETRVKDSLDSAQKSRRKEETFISKACAKTCEELEAAVRARTQATKEDAQEWLDALKMRRKVDGRLVVKRKQFEATVRVAAKVKEELPNRQVRLPRHQNLYAEWFTAGLAQGRRTL